MKLLIYEHISGGGFAGEPIPSGILSEGFAMLRTLISDFKAAGHYVTTTLDSRLAGFNPPLSADCIVPIFSSRDAQVAIRKVSKSANAAYVIAPETEGVLPSLLESVEQTGVSSLNCPVSTVGKVVDKAFLQASLKKLKMPTPETITFSVTAGVEEVRRAIHGRLNFPLIFKPSNDVGCCGLSLVRKENQLAGAVDKIKRESLSKRFLAQELIKGTAASVSLISTGSDALFISFNRQDVTVGAPEKISSYSGGLVPFDHPLRSRAFAVAEKIVKSFRDLRGYVGVDLVLTKEEVVAIEVNPRLTTSYIGLRRVVNFNPAQAIVDAVLKRELPKKIQSYGYAYFSKVETIPPTIDALQKTYEINEVVSPPFPVSSSGTGCALVSSHATTLKAAKAGFLEAKKRMLNTIGKGE